MRSDFGQFPRLRVGLVSQGYDQGLTGCEVMVPRLPKYYTISQKIIGEIKEGRLLPGMRVPSENQIRAEFGVSNTTARRILQEVESTGWAVRIKGSGTFVRTTNVERSVTRILGFTGETSIAFPYVRGHKRSSARCMHDDLFTRVLGTALCDSLHDPSV
jgi:DNA-binding transcriptional MocR family regulator